MKRLRKLKKLQRILFGRTTLIMLFLLIQVGYFFGIAKWLTDDENIVKQKDKY